MNKDVIYIEPEQDITDILSSVKASKHKIVALVPPKKAGVLRSSVNFKLIAKAAAKNDKTVVLVTPDESLRRLASSVSIPVAKNLQSKPQVLDETEIEDDKDAEPEKETEEEKPAEEEAKKEADEEKPADEEKEKQPAKKIAVAAPIKEKKAESAEDDVIEGEPEPDKDAPKTKKEKAIVKMKGTKIPNFAKYRKFIVAGVIALIIIVGFSIWANVVAPAATITIKVKTTAANFTEKVQFVNDESKADAKAGIFFITEKTVTKTAEGEFTATKQVDKGAKATGTIHVVRPAGDMIAIDESNIKFVIPSGTTITIDGKEYVTSKDIDLSADKKMTVCSSKPSRTCTSSEIPGEATITAKQTGESYNIEAKTSGIKSSVSIPSNYKVTTDAVTGGSSKLVTVVSQEDIDKAADNLEGFGEEEARNELKTEFGDNYVFLGSMKKGEPKVTTTPALDEEVGEGVTPKITREISYTMYAVEREPVKQFIEATVMTSLGDDTQIVYDTGVDTGKAFFESFQNSSEENTAKLKSITKTGPRVTDEMVREKSLGKKVGEVQSILKSINGVSSVKVNTSYFWVNSVPNDTNKVEINIENED